VVHDDFSELPEQRLTRELMRINAHLQHGDLTERNLVDLYEVLVQYDSEVDCEPRKLIDPASRLQELTHCSLEHRLSILARMAQDSQSRLRSRALSLTERLVAHDAARLANASYGGVAQREFTPQTLHAFRYQS
jgi:hypothetical protein